MTNDPTTTPGGEADMPQNGMKSGRGRSGARANAPYPEMMGDGTEEQNLNQIGDPSARIREDEVDQAFAAGAAREPRTFIDKTLDKAGANEKLAALTEKVNAMRDQMQQSADAARDWATKQAGAAKDTAQQLHAERPLMVLSVSAGAALAVGLVAGFVIGRATADDY